ncbi:phosphoribosylanthranilate isomerase [Tepidibacillus sp. HK-1]|uniref:phosphoribosylanthranilate isomerase n=1 Tax=Tepidibacillus sp. HK-1 TaxID=1883407 RepID=UPI00085747EF|nr:phosphoribosylanthranilate isomerase [Tepidibacillus sp. HK-1]GBF10380.1 N-(5'-phosphoribosyl)anthranilate isomerase [Tepidibacillus sp. HK-1]
MKVKICGIFQEETLIELKERQIWPDYIGFVFTKSRRQVSAEQVKQWKMHIPNFVKTVGVFVNPSIEQIVEAPVDIIQLHGDETANYCQLIKDMTGKQIWKVLSVEGEELHLPYQPYLDVVDGFIFDTAGANRGGTGTKFDWGVHKETWEKIKLPILVAGGVTANDLKQLKPYSIDGVDLSSGVEVEGLKSVEKIVEVLEEARK